MPKKNYVNNADFLRAVIEYKEQCQNARIEGKQRPQMPNYIGHCVIAICEGIARRQNFASYSYLCEMCSDAQVDCINALESFDPNRSQNIFGFVSKVAWNAFIRRIQREKKQAYIKHVSFTQMMGLGEGCMHFRDTALRKHLDYSQELVDAYDRKINEVKKKKRSSLIEKRLEKFVNTAIDKKGD